MSQKQPCWRDSEPRRSHHMLEVGTAMLRTWQVRDMWYTAYRESGAGHARAVCSCHGPLRYAEVDVWRNP